MPSFTSIQSFLECLTILYSFPIFIALQRLLSYILCQSSKDFTAIHLYSLLIAGCCLRVCSFASLLFLPFTSELRVWRHDSININSTYSRQEQQEITWYVSLWQSVYLIGTMSFISLFLLIGKNWSIMISTIYDNDKKKEQKLCIQFYTFISLICLYILQILSLWFGIVSILWVSMIGLVIYFIFCMIWMAFHGHHMRNLILMMGTGGRSDHAIRSRMNKLLCLTVISVLYFVMQLSTQSIFLYDYYTTTSLESTFEWIHQLMTKPSVPNSTFHHVSLWLYPGIKYLSEAFCLISLIALLPWKSNQQGYMKIPEVSSKEKTIVWRRGYRNVNHQSSSNI